jgi:hypothetical protein
LQRQNELCLLSVVAIGASPSVAVAFTAFTALEAFTKAKRIMVIIGSGNSSITISGSVHQW